MTATDPLFPTDQCSLAEIHVHAHAHAWVRACTRTQLEKQNINPNSTVPLDVKWVTTFFLLIYCAWKYHTWVVNSDSEDALLHAGETESSGHFRVGVNKVKFSTYTKITRIYTMAADAWRIFLYLNKQKVKYLLTIGL